MMFMSFFGVINLILGIAIPVAVIFVLIWIYQIKENGKIQVNQNQKIIELLEKLNK